MSDHTDFTVINSAVTVHPKLLEEARHDDFPSHVGWGLTVGMLAGMAAMVGLSLGGRLTWEQTLLGSGTLALVTGLNLMLARRLQRHADRMRHRLEDKVIELEGRKERDQKVADRLRELNQSLFEAKQTALEASRTKDLFLANISHELRTPLTVIIGYAELLLEEAEDADRDEDAELLGHIEQNAEHLLSLINDILDLSKVEAGKVDLVPEWVDVAGMLDEIWQAVHHLATERKTEVTVEISRRSTRMWTDATRLKQVLLNVVHNAVKFTEGGSVRIHVDRQLQAGVDSLAFTVVDTGIGMSSDQKAKVFQEFIQANPEIGRKYGGTGLGLAITHRTVHLMGGSIFVESEPGQGTTFIVVLPVEVEHASKRPPPPEETNSVVDERAVVVVIADTRARRDTLVHEVGALGYVAVASWSGEEGLRLARELGAQLVIADVDVPGKDGFSVVAEMRGDSELARVPVMLLANRDDIPVLVPIDRYLTKPVASADLKLVTSSYVESGLPAHVITEDLDLRQSVEEALAEQGWKIGSGELDSDELAISPGVLVVDLMMQDLKAFLLVGALRASSPACPIVGLFNAQLSPEDLFLLHKGAERAVVGQRSLEQNLADRLRLELGAPVS